MNQSTAQISSIIKSSLIDGPGNRMVIFFQGCQFNCVYCHNHHTIGLCNGCGICVDSCPSSSLKLINTKLRHEPSTCIKCDKCIEICPENSSPFYQEYSVAELINEIIEIKDFISGITLSGGEVMLQYQFVRQLFQTIKQHNELKHLSLFIDSNGDAEIEDWDTILPYTDGFMIDLKAASSSVHQQITGKGNQSVLQSITYLDSKKKLYEIRTVIVSGLNDTDSETEAISNIHATLSGDVRKIIIKLRKHGLRKEYKHIEPASDSKMKEIADELGQNIIII